MTASDSRSVILILNHVLDRPLAALYKELAAECSDKHDVYLLSDRSQVSASLARLPRWTREFRFTTEGLGNLGYPGKCAAIANRVGPRNIRLGIAELPVLMFHRAHSHYQYYWLVEYDVRYSGRWSDFFAAFDDNDSDLLGTSLTRHDACPEWSHWPSVKIPESPPERIELLRGFFPVYRVSSGALGVLDEAYRAGSAGHMEALVPTTIARAGLGIEDIGGTGEFVKPGNENRFYTNQPNSKLLSPGTFVYRPSRPEVGSEPNKLWHPVKPAASKPKYIVKRAISRLAGHLGVWR